MEASGPIPERDFAAERDPEIDAQALELSDEEIAELDRRVAEADRLSALGVELTSVEDFFSRQRAKFRIAS